MRQTVIAFAAAALVAAALPSSAQARCHGCAVGAGIAGFAAGAIIGSAIANSGPRYVEPAPVYVDPAPGVYYNEAPICHVEHRRVWVNGYGWQPRRIEVCD